MTWTEFSLAALAAVLVGISKAGFGGGTGILATPLMALALPPQLALGVLLPLLITADWVSCWLYRGAWSWKPLLYCLPGCLLGIGAGTFLLGKIDAQLLQRLLGAICLLFCLVQWTKASLQRGAAAVHPGWTSGSAFGFATGLTSTLAHAAGPVFAMYLLPLKLPQRAFLATTVLAFTLVNLFKVPGYLALGVINRTTAGYSLRLALFVILGTLIGEWLNRHCPPAVFTRIIYVILFLTGLELAWGKSLLRAALAFATGSL
ncbi:MAG: sulfite exporter TauE/SafE family protein [Candidatus Methylacidiphilales bacterium]|nr:sulfite exporter TauE/SafE family protein [Candidatus Methylacidiphilales bacterium]